MKYLINNRNLFTAITLILMTIMLSPINAETYPKPGDFAKGAQSWADNCSRCHNMRDPKDLRDDQWITTVFHMRMRAGLTGQQTRDIITFLQQSNNKSSQTSEAQKVKIEENSVSSGLSGKEIYSQTCIACHGVDGEGMVPGAPNFPSQNSPLSKSDDELVKNITNGFQTPGSPMAMPAKGGNSALTTQDIKNVLSYIRDNFSQ